MLNVSIQTRLLYDVWKLRCKLEVHFEDKGLNSELLPMTIVNTKTTDKNSTLLKLKVKLKKAKASLKMKLKIGTFQSKLDFWRRRSLKIKQISNTCQELFWRRWSNENKDDEDEQLNMQIFRWNNEFGPQVRPWAFKRFDQSSRLLKLIISIQTRAS